MTRPARWLTILEAASIRWRRRCSPVSPVSPSILLVRTRHRPLEVLGPPSEASTLRFARRRITRRMTTRTSLLATIAATAMTSSTSGTENAVSFGHEKSSAITPSVCQADGEYYDRVTEVSGAQRKSGPSFRLVSPPRLVADRRSAHAPGRARPSPPKGERPTRPRCHAAIRTPRDRPARRSRA